MIVLSRAFVATNILRYLAMVEGGFASSTRLSEDLGVPLPYLRKVANELGRAGLVVGTRGFRGGLCLARPASEIRLGHVLRLIDETRIGSATQDPAEKLFAGLLDEARVKFYDVLDDHSLADLCVGRPPRKSAETEVAASQPSSAQGATAAPEVSALRKTDVAARRQITPAAPRKRAESRV